MRTFGDRRQIEFLGAEHAVLVSGTDLLAEGLRGALSAGIAIVCADNALIMLVTEI
jgi:hypothetical protein